MYCPTVPTLWVRRCRRCHTIDLTRTWTDPAEAHVNIGAVGKRPWYRLSKRGWECPNCGYGEFTVERSDAPD
jgi:RNA polymerase subunit RPABC4/transcription elongation factor Spt4